MYHYWYTRNKIIRTFRQCFKRYAGITIQVIDHELQMVIVAVNRINKRFDDMTPQQRIVPVAFGELAEEKQTAVAVDELGL